MRVLHYLVDADPLVSYEEAKPRRAMTPDFTIFVTPNALFNGEAFVLMRGVFPTEQAARAVVDPFLRDWEVRSVLQQPPGLKFRFLYSDMSGPPQALNPHSLNFGHSISCPKLLYKPAQFPDPPGVFKANPDVEALLPRFIDYTKGREPLLSMANFCLTYIESVAGGRAKAAKRYRICSKVLSQLGAICATRGNLAEARKAPKNKGPADSLTPSEKVWVDAVVRRLIERLGEHAPKSDGSLPLITMDQFPSLS